MGKFQDLTGQKFNRLTVIKRVDDYITSGGRRKTQYLCFCDCGQSIVVHAERLRNGHTQSCGCLSKENSLMRIQKVNDSGYNICHLEGQKFGRLIVLYMLPKDDMYKNHKIRWRCVCSCGNIVDVSSQSLQQGGRKSCGCLNKEVQSEYEDLSGKVFGYWTVIKRVANKVKPSGQSDPVYLCRCCCGQERTVLAQSLKNGRSYSCGCIKESIGEKQLRDLFDELNLTYKSQLKFDDLLSSNSKCLSYDFGLYNGDRLMCLVEYQGEQHYRSVNYFGGDAKFKRQQIHDNLKRNYAENKLGVPLLEIPYNVKKFEDIKLIFLDFYKMILERM